MSTPATSPLDAAAAQLAPWGSPPTPLLTRWYMRRLATTRLPDILRRDGPPRTAGTRLHTVADLQGFWDYRSEPLNSQERWAIADLASQCGHPRRDLIVIPAGTDPAVLLGLPLRARIRNCIQRAFNQRMLQKRQAVTVAQLLALPNFGLLSLIDLMCVIEAYNAGPSRSRLVSGQTPAEETLSAIVDFRERDSWSPVERLILEERLFAPQPLTLEEIAEAANHSPRRVSQLEHRLWSSIRLACRRTIAPVTAIARGQLPPVIEERELVTYTASLFPIDTTSVQAKATTDVARRVLQQELDYVCADGTCLGPDAVAVLGQLQHAAESLADDEGLLPESELQAQLPDDSWHQYWPDLLKWCDLYHLNGCLSLSKSQKARVKAALLALGRPGTKEEIAEASGLTAGQVRNQLSSLASVVRADKTRWGLADWIDDVYEGIPGEIIQRIHEDGGSTRLSRLLEELPRTFQVSPASVQSYVNSPQFRVDRGYVYLVDPSTVELRDLDTVIDGRDDDGNPYWTFLVLDDHHRGYSATGVPPEFIVAVGGAPSERVLVTVTEPANCRPISAIWRLTSSTGGELGRIGQSLELLDAQPGSHVQVVILNDSSVAIRRLTTNDLQSSSSSRSLERDITAELHLLSQYEPQVTDSRRHHGVTVMSPVSAQLTPPSSGQSSLPSYCPNNSKKFLSSQASVDPSIAEER